LDVVVGALGGGIEGLVEEGDGLLVENQTVGPCSLFLHAPAFGAEPLVVALSFEGLLQGDMDGGFLDQPGVFFRQMMVMALLAHVVSASVGVWGFAAPPIYAIIGGAGARQAGRKEGKEG
jgi:hypothetical protein